MCRFSIAFPISLPPRLFPFTRNCYRVRVIRLYDSCILIGSCVAMAALASALNSDNAPSTVSQTGVKGN